MNPRKRPSRPAFATIYKTLISLPSLFSTTPKVHPAGQRSSGDRQQRTARRRSAFGKGSQAEKGMGEIRGVRDGMGQYTTSIRSIRLAITKTLSNYEDSRSRRSRALQRRSRDGEASPRRAGKGKGEEARRCVHRRRADGSSAREGGQMKQGLSISLCGESRASKERSLGTHVGP